MNRPSNPPTLRELLRPVAAHRVLFVFVIALAIAASVAYSALKHPVYTAQASVAYQDESYDLGLVGLAYTPTQTSDQLAAAGAQTIIQPSVASRVKAVLNSPLSTAALTNSVAATVQPSSNLVVIEASAATASQAQRIANGFATQGAATTNAQQRALYAASYKAALKQLRGHGANATALALDKQQLSKLQVLSTIATTAQVVRPAQLPAAPTSPRPVRDTALAGILGLVLALLVVYVRDTFDRRLRTVTDVEQQFALPVLGHVRAEALGRSPSQNGDLGAAAVDWELFRILRRNFDFLDPAQPPRSVAVTSSVPDEGKSTVASFLAFTSAAAGKRTLLIECDLRRPTLARRLEINQSPGLSDFVLGHAQPDEILQVIRFGDPVSTNGSGPTVDEDEGDGAGSESGRKQYMHELVCVSAGTPTHHPVEVLRSQALSSMLAEVRNAYDLVVLDTPPLLAVVDALELLPHVDSAVVCVRMFSTTRQQAGAGRAALKRLPELPTGLVVTGTLPTAEADYGYYGYYS